MLGFGAHWRDVGLLWLMQCDRKCVWLTVPPRTAPSRMLETNALSERSHWLSSFGPVFLLMCRGQRFLCQAFTLEDNCVTQGSGLGPTPNF